MRYIIVLTLTLNNSIQVAAEIVFWAGPWKSERAKTLIVVKP